MRNKREYSNGYIGKIEYWSKKLLQATSINQPGSTPPDMTEVVRILEKLKYFTARQQEVYPSNKKPLIEKLDLGNGNIIYGV